MAHRDPPTPNRLAWRWSTRADTVVAVPRSAGKQCPLPGPVINRGTSMPPTWWRTGGAPSGRQLSIKSPYTTKESCSARETPLDTRPGLPVPPEQRRTPVTHDHTNTSSNQMKPPGVGGQISLTDSRAAADVYWWGEGQTPFVTGPMSRGLCVALDGDLSGRRGHAGRTRVFLWQSTGKVNRPRVGIGILKTVGACACGTATHGLNELDFRAATKCCRTCLILRSMELG